MQDNSEIIHFEDWLRYAYTDLEGSDEIKPEFIDEAIHC